MHFARFDIEIWSYMSTVGYRKVAHPTVGYSWRLEPKFPKISMSKKMYFATLLDGKVVNLHLQFSE
jgi:hypothetical protein